MRRFLGLLTLLLLPAVPALAQQAPPAPAVAQQTLPAQVGRVSFVQGKLAFHAAGETQWSAASVNYPVAPGGSFWTAPQTRAEFRFGPHTVALSGNTALEVTKLDGHAMQLALREGRINLRLRELAQGDTVEIDIPRGAVTLLQPGVYDIDAGTEDRPARIAVFEGSAKFAGGGADTAIKAGDAAVIGGTGTTLTASLEPAKPDEFAEWCRSRDQKRPAVATAGKRVSPRMTGYEELEPYGTWRSAPDYGEVWYPNDVPTSWAPYRDGNWAWVEPWGWNWVDQEPWGFAPSHYGRWAYLDGAWGWVPPAIGPAPVYAPALVAFLDSPAGLLTPRARGPVVGWFPLGPGEAYWPGYTSDPAYIQAVNAGIDPARLDRAAANAAVANRAASTIVAQSAFANGRRIGPAAMLTSGPALQRAAAGQAPSVRPGKEARGAAVRMSRAAAGGSAFASGGKAARGADKRGGGQFAGRHSGGTPHAFRGGGHGGKHFARGGGHGGGHFARGGGGHGGMHVGGGGPPAGMAHFGAGGGGKHGGGGGHGGGGKHGGGGGHGGGGHGGGGHGGGGGGGKGH